METIIVGLFCTVIGFISGKLKLTSPQVTRILGLILYRFGLPIQIFAIAHKANFIKGVWFPPLTTILVLLLGLFLANLNLLYGK